MVVPLGHFSGRKGMIRIQRETCWILLVSIIKKYIHIISNQRWLFWVILLENENLTILICQNYRPFWGVESSPVWTPLKDVQMPIPCFTKLVDGVLCFSMFDWNCKCYLLLVSVELSTPGTMISNWYPLVIKHCNWNPSPSLVWFF